LTEIWDRTNGRIYKLVYKDQPAVQVDLTKKSNEELAQLTLDKNDFYVRHARRLLQERGAKDAAASLRKLMENPDAGRRLRAMWAMHGIGELSQHDVDAALGDGDPYVRGWAIQLMMEDAAMVRLTGPFTEPAAAQDAQRRTWQLAHLQQQANSDSPVVRLYVASALQRLTYSERWPIVEALVAHSEDASDFNLPLLYWYAAEPAVGANAEKAIALAKKSAIPLIREFIARRLSQAATAQAGSDPAKVDTKPLAALATLLAESTDSDLQKNLIAGMTDGLKGWPSCRRPRAGTRCTRSSGRVPTRRSPPACRSCRSSSAKSARWHRCARPSPTHRPPRTSAARPSKRS
jgi:hypothetical protein